MEIVEFLPKYPNIDNTKYELLNPYDEDFNQAIFRKKEFYENRLTPTEEKVPNEPGLQLKYQKTLARFISSKTPYDAAIVIHFMGSGKSCTTIGAIELIRSENSSFDGAVILAKGDTLLDNFLTELVEKCTPGIYLTENYFDLSNNEKRFAMRKKNKDFYRLESFQKFAKQVKKLSEDEIREKYSNKIIVIDEVHNLRKQDDKEEGFLESYKEIHRFLHIITNCKIILLSGTPIKDSIDEIAGIANLVLPLKDQFPDGENFIREFTDFKDGVYKIKKSKVPEFKEKLKGLISFLKEPESNVQKEFIGVPKYKGLKYFTVAPNSMSSFQTKNYKVAYERDKTTQAGVYNNSREAILFVYPDGSFGKAGFQKFITEPKPRKFKMHESLKKKLRGKDREETLRNIEKHSSTYAAVIRQILETKGNCFVYSYLVKGSGAILFSLLLELVGFSQASGTEKTAGMRYCILTNKTAGTAKVRKLVERFNKKDNIHGEIIKVIVGSGTVSEGFTFKNVIFEAINTPYWNYSVIAQALARGIRIGSHRDLELEAQRPRADLQDEKKGGKENITVKIMLPVAMPNDDTVESLNLQMYKISADKDISIKGVTRLLTECAFDCALNYARNHVSGKEGSRECDYTKCDYICDNIDMSLVEKGIPAEDLDYSTYQLYYTSPNEPFIRRKIEELLRENIKMDVNSIVNALKTEYSKEEIEGALVGLSLAYPEKEFTIENYLSFYARTSVQKLIVEIENIFRKFSIISLTEIKKRLKGFTDFEILSSLNKIIFENIVLFNKFNLQCYLREENNTFFLVNIVNAGTNMLTSYYIENPYIEAHQPFENIIKEMYRNSLPSIIERLSAMEDFIKFSNIVKTLPKNIQEMMIEGAIISVEKYPSSGDGEEKNNFRKNILELYKSYIKKINGVWSSSFLKDTENILRCYKDDIWYNCEDSYQEVINEEEKKEEEKILDNKYGIIGKYNPITQSFCLVDLSIEKKVRETISEKREAAQEDRRLKYLGKVCNAGGWKVPDLLKLVIVRLKVSPPADFRQNDNREKMITAVKKESILMKIFSAEDVDKMSEKMLRRVLYWGTTKKDGGVRGIKTICEHLKDWLKSKGLLQIDKQCGVQGKKKIEETKDKTKVFRIEKVVPSDSPAIFKEYLKDISKLMLECFDIKKYKPEIDKKTWVLAFLRKKLVAMVTLDGKDKLSNVCVAKNYKRQGLASQAISQALNQVCSIRGVSPSLLVDNKDANSKKLIKMYTGFGFEIEKTDDAFTYMKHDCKKK